MYVLLNTTVILISRKLFQYIQKNVNSVVIFKEGFIMFSKSVINPLTLKWPNPVRPSATYSGHKLFGYIPSATYMSFKTWPTLPRGMYRYMIIFLPNWTKHTFFHTKLL